MRTHDSIYVADHDRFDLKRAEFAVTASGMIVSVGFDLNEGREKQWMHDLMRDRGLFVGFDGQTPRLRDYLASKVQIVVVGHWMREAFEGGEKIGGGGD